MRYILTIVLFFVCKLGTAQVYQLMPQYGYDAKRFNFDSTLSIPTTCGVPTLRSNVTKKAAIAYDSCNKRFYYYDPKLLAWDTIKGGGASIDTTSLSNRINLKIDSLKKSNDSIFFSKNGTWTFSFKDSVGSTSGYVPYVGATQDVDLGANKISAASVYVTGTNGNGHIHLKHQNGDATATGQSTSLYANNQGYLKWKNDGDYYTTLATPQTADRVFTFQNKSYTIGDSADISLKLNSSDSSIYQTKFRSDTSRTNIYNSIASKENALTFSTGLTRSTNTITSNISTGIIGGQSIYGGVNASDSLRLFSTSNATKGFLYFGSSTYDENNNRLGINTRTPTMPLDVTFSSVNSMAANISKTQTRLNSGDQGDGAMSVSYTLSGSGAGTELVTRVFQLGSTNAWTSGTTTNARVFNLATNTNSSTTTTNLDAVYIENGTTAGSVTNYRAILVNNTQGTSRAGLVVNNISAGTNKAYVLLGTSAIPSGTWSIYSSNTDKSYFNGNVLIGTTTDAGFKLDVNGTARANQFQLSALNTAPATATSTGTTGEIRIVNGFIYVCVATNTWQRAALTTW